MSFEVSEETRGLCLVVLKFCYSKISLARGITYTTSMTYFSEFSLVKHVLRLDSNLFVSHLKGTIRREDHVLLFFHYGKISLGGDIAQVHNYEIS